MKSILLILAAAFLITSCGKSNKSQENAESKSDELTKVQKEIMDKVMKADFDVASFSKRPKRNNRISAGLINIGLNPISGTAELGHGLTEDTIDITVPNFGLNRAGTEEATWWNIFVSHQDNNAPYPGRIVFDDINTSIPPRANSLYRTKRIIWAHDGLNVSYFISVSSDEGWNVAGKQLQNF